MENTEEKVQAEEVKVEDAINDVEKEEKAEKVEAEETTTEEVNPAEAELKAKDAKIEELQNRLLRLQADFDNFRRRNQEEQASLSRYVTASVAKEFLKVLDNFERAEDSLAKSMDGDALKVGMEKIHKQFEQALNALKIEEIKAQGEAFDPQFHEAVMQGANPEVKDDHVDLVLEKGYKIGDNIIRHSKVRVVHND